MNRRKFLQTSALSLVTPVVESKVELNATGQMLQRLIPSTGEKLPVVGLGTWQSFDVSNDQHERQNLKGILKAFVQHGGKVIDSSPMYGSSESVVGDLANELNINSDLFLATKVWTNGKAAGINQMQQSLQRMRTKQMDLMQVHNLLDAETHLETLHDWKTNKRIRYIGLTHYHSGGYQQMKQLMLAHDIDFIQINYSILSREAELDLLPIAKEKGIAVLINRPYDGGNLFSKVKNRQLPTWARDFDCDSWGQFFLKFILANESVTCVIPGTSKLHHLNDNLSAGTGGLPTEAQRLKMSQFFEQI